MVFATTVIRRFVRKRGHWGHISPKILLTGCIRVKNGCVVNGTPILKKSLSAIVCIVKVRTKNSAKVFRGTQRYFEINWVDTDIWWPSSTKTLRLQKLFTCIQLSNKTSIDGNFCIRDYDPRSKLNIMSRHTGFEYWNIFFLIREN